jgi:hypothetical protein
VNASMRSEFYVTAEIGPKQSLTPEGFLLCKDVPIARVGTYIYGPNETPIAPGPDGVVHIERTRAEVFRPETIASFNGKPFVDEHPSQPDETRWTVDPHNWREVARGVVLSPRQGLGADDDVLLADILITDAESIDYFYDAENGIPRPGKREVSCGYLAEYKETAPGWGYQYDIIGNHLAHVIGGRCGSRCSIADSALILNQESVIVTCKNKVQQWKDSLLDAFKSKKTEAEFKQVLDAAPKEDESEEEKKKTEDARVRRVADAVAEKISEDMEPRFKNIEDGMEDLKKKVGDKKVKDETEEEEEKRKKKEKEEEKETEDKKIEGELEEEAPEGTGDKAKHAKDSAYMADSFQEVVSIGEIIAPGFNFPTFDSKAQPVKTLDTLCKTRRTILDLAYSADPTVRAHMETMLHGKQIKDCKCNDVRTIFRSVGDVKSRQNNQANSFDSSLLPAGGGIGIGANRKIKTIAELNAANRKRYGQTV